jgi:NAD(P)-dependent dehydrogenase (short-subunit alcohol dehydrogenase family)
VLPRGAQRLGVRRIVVTSSILARIAVPDYTGYSASRRACSGSLRSLAAELAPETTCERDRAGLGRHGHGLGGARRDERGRAKQAHAEADAGGAARAHDTRPDEIAGTVSWLLSEDAATVTGQGNRPQRRRLDGLSPSDLVSTVRGRDARWLPGARAAARVHRGTFALVFIGVGSLALLRAR